jgi:hypothetical protein
VEDVPRGVNAARGRLVAQAAAAGHPPDLLGQIAGAVLPGYTPGSRLTDLQVDQVTDAVQVIGQAGYDRQQLLDVLDSHQTQQPDHWRSRFWKSTVAIAAVR